MLRGSRWTSQWVFGDFLHDNFEHFLLENKQERKERQGTEWFQTASNFTPSLPGRRLQLRMRSGRGPAGAAAVCGIRCSGNPACWLPRLLAAERSCPGTGGPSLPTPSSVLTEHSGSIVPAFPRTRDLPPPSSGDGVCPGPGRGGARAASAENQTVSMAGFLCHKRSLLHILYFHNSLNM